MSENYESETLFKKLPSGATRQWRSWSHGNQVWTEHGQVGGKLQKSRDVVRGKNSGRANATTPEQQAASEARSLRDKVIKKGYVSSRTKAGSTDNALPAFLPMLAHVYEDVRRPPVYPAYVQPKLDGVRCLAVVRGGKATLYTRSQKVVDTVPQVNAAVEDLARRRRISDFQLDGEFYNHEFYDDFGRILGAIKRKGVGEDAGLVHYCVYDFPSVDQPFTGRLIELEKLLEGCELPLVRVSTEVVLDEAAMRSRARHYVEMGYEGVMYRSPTSAYEGKRSQGLLKVKTMRDEEFTVVGFQEGRGRLMGLIGSFICEMKTGTRFNAKLEGSLLNLPRKDAGANYVGKILTVRYQGLTPDGVPRFPVGVRFKDPVEV